LCCLKKNLSCFLLQEYHIFLVAKISGTISVFFCYVFFRSNTVVGKFYLSVVSLSLSPGTVISFFSSGNLPKVCQQVDVSTLQRMGSSRSPFFLQQANIYITLAEKALNSSVAIFSVCFLNGIGEQNIWRARELVTALSAICLTLVSF
jgi:hypothetical protein